jgi:hypothetical protein
MMRRSFLFVLCWVYEATLKDFDIHLIPEDQSMREIVERLWTDHQNEQPAGVGHA